MAASKWADATGEAWIQSSRNGVVQVGMAGFVHARLGRAVCEALAVELGPGHPRRLFFDLERLRAYGAEVRSTCIRVLDENRAQVASLTALVGGRMEVTPASGARDLVVELVRDRPAFELAIARVGDGI